MPEELDGVAGMITREQLSHLGQDLAVLGAIVSCAGVVANNLWLDHILAMQIWRMSNPIMLLWALGISQFTISYRGQTLIRKQQWWTGGLGGIALVGMYLFYVVTNEWGLMQ